MEFIRTLDVKFDVRDAVRLRVESRSGTVAVRGDDTSTVRVEVVARLWAEDEHEADDQAELIRRGIQHEGDKVSVRAPTLLRPRPFLIFASRGPRIDYQITVPTKTEAKIESRSGLIEVEAIAGPLRIDSKSGKVSVRDVTSDVEIRSRSGAVQAESIGGSLDAEAISGSVTSDLHLREDGGGGRPPKNAPKVRIRTVSGSIHIASN